MIPSYIKAMTNKYKEMCGCEICISIKSLQNDLNSYRLLNLTRLERSGVMIIFSMKLIDATDSTTKKNYYRIMMRVTMKMK